MAEGDRMEGEIIVLCGEGGSYQISPNGSSDLSDDVFQNPSIGL